MAMEVTDTSLANYELNRLSLPRYSSRNLGGRECVVLTMTATRIRTMAWVTTIHNGGCEQ